MILLSAVFLDIGGALVTFGARFWLKDFEGAGDAAQGAADSLKKRFEDLRTQKQGELLFIALQNDVSTRLSDFVDAEFSGIAENEKMAAAIAVRGILSKP